MPGNGAADSQNADVSSRQGDVARSFSASGSLRLALNCPNCGVAGEVEYQKLVRGLRCHKCHQEFAVVRGGHVVSLADLPQLNYACPRCGKVGKLPVILANRNPRCGSCGLPLAKGPDQHLYSVEEAERLRRLATIAEREAREQQQRERLRQGWSPAMVRRMKQALAGAVAVSVFAFILWIKLCVVDGTISARATQFTRTCLAGDWDRAAAYFEDDAVQQMEFDRWRMRHFTSILDKYRPDGDRVSIAIEIIADEPTAKILRVTLTSEFLGSRSLEQCWRWFDNCWLFNSRATVAHETRAVAKSTTRPPRIRKR